MFDGSNYAFWSIRMRAFIEAQGIEIWQSIENGYKVPRTVPTDAGELVQYNNNSKARNHLLSAIDESVFNKVMNCPSAKEVWDKLQTTYEGDHKVKEAKLQTYRGQFEQLRMNEDEDIAAYILRVDQLVNTIRGLGEEVEETIVVRKILRTLPKRFNKISALEERTDLDTMTVDQLHGTLVAYEMRIEDEYTSRKEAAFKVSSKQDGKNKSMKDKPTSDESDDEEIANFVRKLKRGTGKYKGKLPLKCFSCGKIGHFASKCSYAKNSDGEEDDNFKPYKKYNNYKNKNRRKFAKKKSLYTKRDNSSSSGDSDNDSVSDSDHDGESDKVFFMAISSDKDLNSNEESKDEGEADIEAELVSAMKELKKVGKENRMLKEESQRFEQIIVDLKTKLEEAKRVEDSLTEQLRQI